MNHVKNLEQRLKELFERQLELENQGGNSRELDEIKRKIELADKMLEAITLKKARRW